MLALYERSEPIDTVTVTDALRAAGTLEQAGGPEGVDILGGRGARTSRTCASTRRSCARRRCCGGCSNATYEIQSSVLDQREPAREVVERAEQAVLEVAHGERTQDFRSISSLLNQRARRAPRALGRRRRDDRHADRASTTSTR